MTIPDYQLEGLLKWTEEQANRETKDAWDRGYRAGMNTVREYLKFAIVPDEGAALEKGTR